MPAFLPNFVELARETSRAAQAAMAVVAFAVVALPQAQAAAVDGQGTWQTTLQARDLDGNGSIDAYYDTDLNITWQANAGGGYGTWAGTNTWASNLVVGGHSGWRLPTMADTGPPGCVSYGPSENDCGFFVSPDTSELAHMYFVTLGNKALLDSSGHQQSGYGLSNKGPFSNLQLWKYWTNVAYAPDANDAWYFDTMVGYQSHTLKDDTHSMFSAWAVHSGDIGAPVPEPGTMALGLIGMAALLVAVKRQRG